MQPTALSSEFVDPSVRPSVLGNVTETAGVRPTARPFWSRSFQGRVLQRTAAAVAVARRMTSPAHRWCIARLMTSSPHLRRVHSPHNLHRRLRARHLHRSWRSTSARMIKSHLRHPTQLCRQPSGNRPRSVRTSRTPSLQSRSTSEMNADALDLARQLAGSLQHQLQQQRDDARDR